MSFDPTCLSLNVALAKRADRDQIRQRIEDVRRDGQHRDQLFRHPDDLLDEIGSARGHAGRAVFQVGPETLGLKSTHRVSAGGILFVDLLSGDPPHSRINR